MARPDRFTLTEEHIKLLQAMWVDWQDGAPAIEPKRPYGNSDVPGDIHELLTGESVDNDVVVLNREQRDRYLALHRETETALQVVLRAGSFEPGDYVCETYKGNWQRALV